MTQLGFWQWFTLLWGVFFWGVALVPALLGWHRWTPPAARMSTVGMEEVGHTYETKLTLERHKGKPDPSIVISGVRFTLEPGVDSADVFVSAMRSMTRMKAER